LAIRDEAAIQAGASRIFSVRPALVAGFFMRGRIGGMAGPNDPVTVIDILAAIAGNFAPVGVAVVLLVVRDRRGRFSLPMLLTLTTFVALSAWAWGIMLRHP